MTPLYGPDSNQESMPCIWNWCSWSTTWFPTVDTAPVSATSSKGTQQCCLQAGSRASTAKCRRCSWTTCICSIRRWMHLLIHALCYVQVHLSITCSGTYIKEERRATGVNVAGCQAALAGSVSAPPVHTGPAFGVCLTNGAWTGLQLNSEQELHTSDPCLERVLSKFLRKHWAKGRDWYILYPPHSWWRTHRLLQTPGGWRRNICIQSSPLEMASKGGILASNLLALVRLLERDLSSGALRTPRPHWGSVLCRKGFCRWEAAVGCVGVGCCSLRCFLLPSTHDSLSSSAQLFSNHEPARQTPFG